jgi:uncharacterized membrane protein YvlD (DUF360 family)
LPCRSNRTRWFAPTLASARSVSVVLSCRGTHLFICCNGVSANSRCLVNVMVIFICLNPLVRPMLSFFYCPVVQIEPVGSPRCLHRHEALA